MPCKEWLIQEGVESLEANESTGWSLANLSIEGVIGKHHQIIKKTNFQAEEITVQAKTKRLF